MRLRRLRLELRVTLHRQEPRVVRQLDHLHQLDDVPRELDHRALESQADAEEGDALLPGEADGLDLAGDAAVAEAARHQDTVDAAQGALGPLALDLLRLDAADDDPAVQRD